MSISDEQAALLEDIDDDAYGLWEIDWWYNGVHPEWDHPRRAAQVVLAIEAGMLDVFRGEDYKLLSMSEALALVSDPSNWVPRTPEKELFSAMTNAVGVAAVRSSDWAKRLRS